MPKVAVSYEQPLTKEEQKKKAAQPKRTEQVEPAKQSTAEDWIRGRIKRVRTEEEARLNKRIDYKDVQP